jgi:hypothetical protein
MVLECSISDDGTRAAKITSDGRFVLVDVAGKRAVWKRKVPANGIHAVAVDPTGKLLAYSHNCRELVVEDTAGHVTATYPFPGTSCLDVHALAMAAGGYPIALGACGRGIYTVQTAASPVERIREIFHCEDELDGVQSLSVDSQGTGVVAGWMYGCSHWPSVRDVPDPSDRHHADWWQETGKGKGIGVTVFDLHLKSVVAELAGEQASSVDLSRDGRLLAIGYADDEVSLWSMTEGRRRWASDVGAGFATGFVGGERFVVAERSGPISDPYLIYILDSSNGKVLTKARAKADIMTRGNFSARNGDKFLVAHRTGMVDVYQVSPDGRKISKYWEF